MSKPPVAMIIINIVGATIFFLAAAVFHVRLLPFLQADTITLRHGIVVPTEQFIAYAVPISIAIGCFLFVCIIRVWVTSRRGKAT